MLPARFVAIAGLLGLAALGASAQPAPPAGASTTPVAVSLRTDKKAYHKSDPIKLTFTVKNASKSPVKLTIPSGMKYDFEIRKGKPAAGEKLWQWSRGRMFTEMVVFMTMEPGKQVVYSETFKPGEQGSDGKPVPALEPGTYTASAILQLAGRAPRPTATTTFVVK